MKKGLLLVGVLLSMALVGCQAQQLLEEHEDAAAKVEISNETKQDADHIIYGKDGLPPLDDELIDFYKEAYGFYQKYYFGSFQLDCNHAIVVDDQTYYQVNEKDFSTLSGLEDQMNKYFTGTALNEMLSEMDNFFVEQDGNLYALSFGGAANLFYAGHVFQLVSQSNEKIELKLIRYMAKELEDVPEKAFYEVPSELEKYDVEEMPFVLEKDGADWKFSEFQLVDK